VARDPATILIGEEHSSAICAEIGDRLRIALRELAPVSPDLARLIARLGELDEHDSPSIVPSIDEISSAWVELAD
jgi:hypothetical protein